MRFVVGGLAGEAMVQEPSRGVLLKVEASQSDSSSAIQTMDSTESVVQFGEPKEP
jgi:hypothetical protein